MRLGVARWSRQRERVSAGEVLHVQHGIWAAYTTDKCR